MSRRNLAIRPPLWLSAFSLLTAAACGTSVVRVAGMTNGGSTGNVTGGNGPTTGASNGGSTGNATGGNGPTTGAATGAGGSGTGGAPTSGTGGGTGAAATTGGGATGGTGGALDQPCSIDNNMDTCVAAGLVCEYSTDPAHMGTVCELPGEFQPCQVAVGCNDASLQCLSFSTGSYCFISCESSSDCKTLYTTCQGGPPSVCYLDYCDVGAGADGGFASCNAAGLDDGTCIPNTGAGLCLQGGTAAPGALCDDQRGAGVSSADLCAPNAACIPGGISGASHCAPLCGIDGGPSCPSPTFCQPSQAGPWGYCL
jgi:hypothetical protein